MSRNVITVRNVTVPATDVIVKDFMLPGGKVVIAPGKEHTFDRFVWRRLRGRYRFKLISVDSLAQQAGESPPESELDTAIEKVDEEVPTSDSMADEDDFVLSMGELRSRAKELGINSYGMKKQEIIAAIKAAKEGLESS